MVTSIIKPTKLTKQKERQPAKRCATKYVKWGNKNDIQVSLAFSNQKPVGSRKSISLTERCEACIWWFDHLQFDFAEKWRAPYPNQVLSLTTLLQFSSHISLSSLEGFSLIDFLVGFSSLVSYNWVGRFFTSNMIFGDLSASLRS